jgi:nicotinate-nucleotide adenylyltransferase
MAEHSDLDQIWMVTPHNPLKKNTLLDDYHRLQMVHLATEDFKIKPSDIEFKLSQPNYTVIL